MGNSWFPLGHASMNGIITGGWWFKIVYEDHVLWVSKKDAQILVNVLSAALQDSDLFNPPSRSPYACLPSKTSPY